MQRLLPCFCQFHDMPALVETTWGVLNEVIVKWIWLTMLILNDSVIGKADKDLYDNHVVL